MQLSWRQMMKKIFAAAVMLLVFLCACGRSEEAERARTSPYGEIIDNGELSVLCPYGWYQEKTADLSTNETEPSDTLLFVRGVKGESAIDSSPYIKIVHYSGEETIVEPEITDYGDPKDTISAYSSGRYTWKGFMATTDGHTFTFVQTSAEEEHYAVWLWMRVDTEDETRITDDDVRRILDSIQLSDDKDK